MSAVVVKRPAINAALRAFYRPVLERELDRSFELLCYRLGYLTFHAHSSQHSEGGFPDRVAIGGPSESAVGKAPRMIVAELKREDGRLEKGRRSARGGWIVGQDEWLDRFHSCWPAVETYVLYPSDGQELPKLLQEGPLPELLCVQRSAARRAGVGWAELQGPTWRCWGRHVVEADAQEKEKEHA